MPASGRTTARSRQHQQGCTLDEIGSLAYASLAFSSSSHESTVHSAFQGPSYKSHCCLQVDFNAATEYDAVNNYKVLQAAFTKMGIDKVSYLYPFNARQQPRYLICLGHIVALCIRMLHASAWLPWLQIAVNPSGALRAHGDQCSLPVALKVTC